MNKKQKKIPTRNIYWRIQTHRIRSPLLRFPQFIRNRRIARPSVFYIEGWQIFYSRRALMHSIHLRTFRNEPRLQQSRSTYSLGRKAGIQLRQT